MMKVSLKKPRLLIFVLSVSAFVTAILGAIVSVTTGNVNISAYGVYVFIAGMALVCVFALVVMGREILQSWRSYNKQSL